MIYSKTCPNQKWLQQAAIGSCSEKKNVLAIFAKSKEITQIFLKTFVTYQPRSSFFCKFNDQHAFSIKMNSFTCSFFRFFYKFKDPLFYQNTSCYLLLYISLNFAENPSVMKILQISQNKFRGGLRNPCHIKNGALLNSLC